MENKYITIELIAFCRRKYKIKIKKFYNPLKSAKPSQLQIHSEPSLIPTQQRRNASDHREFTRRSLSPGKKKHIDTTKVYWR